MMKIAFCHVSGYRLYPGGRTKIWLLMRLTFILLLASVLTVHARSYSQTVSLSLEKTSLQRALNEIRQQTGFAFLWDQDAIDNKPLINIKVSNVDVREALKECFKGLPLVYEIHGKVVYIKQKIQGIAAIAAATGPAQLPVQMNVHGRVTDSTGKPIGGVSVSVSETKRGTITDADGAYQVSAGMGDQLQFSFIGYVTKTVTIGRSGEINVQLHAMVSSLNDMVVVGYGVQKKVDLTGAITTVKGKDIESRPVSNATKSLEGIAPGLNVTVAGNTHPGSSFNLNIRGTGNLSGSDQPYVLVDGVAMSLSDVNPQDIESISILKDAAASAIYGARAPYGVILVTTKSGKAGRMQIQYSNNVGMTTPLGLPDPVNSYQYALYFNAATFNATGTKQYSDDQLALLKAYIRNPDTISIYPGITSNSYSALENSSAGVANTNWIDFNYKPNAYNQTHNLSVSGGNENTRYYVSGGYYKENGLLRYANMDFDRLNFNANVTSSVTKWMKFNIDTKFINSDYTAPFNGTFEQLFYHDMIRMRPNISPYDLNGNFNEISFVPYLRSGSKYDLKNYNYAIISGLEIQPVSNWKIYLNLNYTRSEQQSDELRLPALVYGLDGTPVYMNRSEFGIPLLGGYNRTTNSTNYVSPNIYTTYNYSINHVHNFSATAGFQQEVNDYQQLSASAQDLISATTPGINLSTGTQSVLDNRNHWATRGYFARFNYNYKEKYLLEINGRRDGSSRFSPDHRWGTFPSASIGYNIAKENFMKPLAGKIDLLKLRLSYGALGNQSGAGLYSYTQLVNIVTPGASGAGTRWFFQDGREGNLQAPQPYNPDLTWEKVQTGNAGLDFALLKNRLSGSIDVYQRDTKDMLGPAMDVADMYGGTPPASNNANLRTRGFELALNWSDKIGSKITYNVFANLSNSKSVVTKYQNPTNSNPSGSWYVGKTVGEIWGYTASGLIQTQEEADQYNQLNLSFLTGVPWKPGDVKYNDLNHDNKINNGSNKLGDMGDMKIIGNSSPRYAFSFGGTIDYANFSLYALFQGIGKMNFAPPAGDAYFWGSGALAQVVTFKQHLDYWTADNPNAYYPNPYAAPAGAISSYTAKTQQVSDRYLQNAAYMRLKNVTLSYSLPQAVLSKIKIRQVKIFVTGENLLTITGLTRIFDPEMLAGGIEPGKWYPLTKTYSMGINVTL